MVELTHVSLFTGIGGIDIAAEWAGFETICFVEIDKYCQKVLNKHWPDVPIIGDIRDVTKEKVMAHTNNRRQPRNLGQALSEQRNTQTSHPESGSGSESRHALSAANREQEDRSTEPITLITGGFPCQPVSVAGKRKGKEDDRWLWPEMLRVISEIRPTWVVAENVAGLLRMGFNDCVSDLESEGYETASFLIPACAVNAPHRRDRVFIVARNTAGDRSNKVGAIRWGENANAGGVCEDVAHAEPERARGKGGKASDEGRKASQERGKGIRQGDRETSPGGVAATGGDASNTKKQSQRKPSNQENTITRSREARQEPSGGDWWAVEPGMGMLADGLSSRLGGYNPHHYDREPDIPRVATGIKHRVEQLKAYGNAVDPMQIYPILKAIADIERGSW